MVETGNLYTGDYGERNRKRKMSSMWGKENE